MHYQGMVPGRPFPVDRPLDERDRKHRLLQDSRIEGPAPYSDLSVIRLNSTYLEIVDKYYGWKGWAGFMSGAMALMLVSFSFAILVTGVGHFRDGDLGSLLFGVVWAVVFMSMAALGIFLFRFEWAYYTHYPIRLNRKTQMVHVFRRDGSVLSVPWSEVFFTLDHDAGFWGIRGHVLEADRETVKETFALGTFATVKAPEPMRMLHAHWEFFRRYMAEGPEAVASHVKQALPIDGRRESFRVGYEALASHFRHPSALGAVISVLGWPIIAVSSLGRWVAMRISKIPQWPDEIKAVNVVADDDPYRIDSRINPPELR